MQVVYDLFQSQTTEDRMSLTRSYNTFDHLQVFQK